MDCDTYIIQCIYNVTVTAYAEPAIPELGHAKRVTWALAEHNRVTSALTISRATAIAKW